MKKILCLVTLFLLVVSCNLEEHNTHKNSNTEIELKEKERINCYTKVTNTIKENKISLNDIKETKNLNIIPKECIVPLEEYLSRNINDIEALLNKNESYFKHFENYEIAEVQKEVLVYYLLKNQVAPNDENYLKLNKDNIKVFNYYQNNNKNKFSDFLFDYILYNQIFKLFNYNDSINEKHYFNYNSYSKANDNYNIEESKDFFKTDNSSKRKNSSRNNFFSSPNSRSNSRSSSSRSSDSSSSRSSFLNNSSSSSSGSKSSSSRSSGSSSGSNRNSLARSSSSSGSSSSSDSPSSRSSSSRSSGSSSSGRSSSSRSSSSSASSSGSRSSSSRSSSSRSSSGRSSRK